MPANLIYVPTDRQCADQVEQLAQEALLIREKAGGCLVAQAAHHGRSRVVRREAQEAIELP